MQETQEPQDNTGEEFYHKDLFGGVVDVDLLEEDERDLLGPKSKEPFFNIFALTEAFATKDKKNAWILYQKALASGLVPEQVYWKLAWQVKSLLLAAKTNTAQEADMKDYPYKKAKSALKLWKPGELEQLSLDLIQGYCQARVGEGEIETLVEKILLKL